VTHGIVDTVDEIQEALAPTGARKVGGYDTRDAEGNLGAVTGSPQDHIDNPFVDSGLFTYASNVPDNLPAPAASLTRSGRCVCKSRVLTIPTLSVSAYSIVRRCQRGFPIGATASTPCCR